MGVTAPAGTFPERPDVVILIKMPLGRPWHTVRPPPSAPPFPPKPYGRRPSPGGPMTSPDALTEWRRLDAVTRRTVKQHAAREHRHPKPRVAAVAAAYATALLARPTAWIYAVVLSPAVLVPLVLLWDVEETSWPEKLIVIALASIISGSITAGRLQARRVRLLQVFIANREPRAFALSSVPDTVPTGMSPETATTTPLTARVTLRRLLWADKAPLGLVMWILIGLATLLVSPDKLPSTIGYWVLLVIFFARAVNGVFRWLYWLRGNRTALIVSPHGVVLPGVRDIRMAWDDIAEVRLLPLAALYRDGRRGDTVVAFVPASRQSPAHDRENPPRWGDVRADFIAMPDGWLSPPADEIASAVVRLSDVPVYDYRWRPATEGSIPSEP
ncbi:MAG: hypothetical protein JWQ95_3895 [Sphaerisporangium sp.]|nr:hypothetical protein [Sphaerisporangium sp.]